MRKEETFYDWCMNNDGQKYLDAWDYEKNPDTPKHVFHDGEKRYFICPRCGKSSLCTVTSIMKRNRLPGCFKCETFGDWCIENKRQDLLKRWDYEKTGFGPFDVSKCSTKAVYLKCPRGIHPSEQKSLSNLVKQFNSRDCLQCKSFGQWGIDTLGSDFLEKYWSDKNVKDPMKLWRGTTQKVWIKCQNKDYHEDYQVSCSNFTKGKRCPYCANKKVHPRDSLGSVYPESAEFWFQKNLTPFQVSPGSNKKVYWKCEKHGLYRRSISHAVQADFVCPKCVKEDKESKMEKRVRLYLDSIFGEEDVKHELDCTICPVNPKTGKKLRYDNEVVSLKLVI